MKINQRGQSMLEVAVSLGLILIIITILTITTITGLKNSQFAKNQVLASSYAAQGIELVKIIKQKDCRLSTLASGNFYWSDSTKGTLIWAPDSNPLPDTNDFSFTIDTANCVATQDPLSSTGEVINQVFQRKIKLERINGNKNIIRVTVNVTWDDSSGQHSAQNVSLVTNY